jgi:hypothetical protein
VRAEQGLQVLCLAFLAAIKALEEKAEQQAAQLGVARLIALASLGLRCLCQVARDLLEAAVAAAKPSLT